MVALGTQSVFKECIWFNGNIQAKFCLSCQTIYSVMLKMKRNSLPGAVVFFAEMKWLVHNTPSTKSDEKIDFILTTYGAWEYS